MDSLLKTLIPSHSQDGPGWEEATFLARLTNVYVPTSGSLSGLRMYSFIEQTYDPQTGLPIDVQAAGRRTIVNNLGVPLSNWAIEANNAAVTMQATPTPPFINSGPFVEMRLRSLVNGAPVYEFEVTSSVDLEWVRIPFGTTSQTIQYHTGGYLTAWPGIILIWNDSLGSWINGAGVYFWSPTGVSPPIEPSPQVTLYQCRYIGQSLDGLAIWASALNYPTYSISGASGTDGVGNMFVDGICQQVGGPLGSTGTVDGGSYW